MENSLIIDKCKIEDLDKVIELSKACTMQIQNGVVIKVGISEPVEVSDFQDLVVAKINDEVIGSLVMTNLNDDDKEWYGLSKNASPITIMKICTKESLRGNGVAGAMINFVKTQHKGKDIYVDIMASPMPNTKSRRAFESQGFMLEREAPYYFKDKNLHTSWWIYKFTAK